jgi:hypothetical protein
MRQVRTTEPLLTGVPNPRTEAAGLAAFEGAAEAEAALAFSGSKMLLASSLRPRGLYHTEFGSFCFAEIKALPQFVT